MIKPRQAGEVSPRPGLPSKKVARAFDSERDRHLRVLDARHLFEINVTRLDVQRGTWLRGYAHSFIENFARSLTRQMVEEALNDGIVTA